MVVAHQANVRWTAHRVLCTAARAARPSFLVPGYHRQHEMAVALREIGRMERTLFIID